MFLFFAVLVAGWSFRNGGVFFAKHGLCLREPVRLVCLPSNQPSHNVSLLLAAVDSDSHDQGLFPPNVGVVYLRQFTWLILLAFSCRVFSFCGGRVRIP